MQLMNESLFAFVENIFFGYYVLLPPIRNKRGKNNKQIGMTAR